MFIFSNIWLGFIFLSLVTIQFEYNYSGIIYILTLCLIASLVNLCIGFLMADNSVENKVIDFNIKKSSFFLIGTVLLGMLVPILNMRLNGFSINNFFDFNSFLEMNNQMAVNRYSGVHKTSTSLQILMVFEYFSPIVGGYHFASTENKSTKIIGLIGFLPAVCNILVQNTKSELLSCIFLFMSTVIIANIYLNKKIHVKIRTIVRIILVVLGTVSGLIVTMLFRIGTINEQNIQTVLNKFLVYAFGHIPVFDEWIKNYQGLSEYGFGTKTFIGIFNVLGLSERIQGVYSEYIYVEGFPANVYTVFRGMIEDFGVVGSVLFFVVIAGVISFGYYSLAKKNHIY
ncbi:O-antigen polymerase, partial [Leuconostoc lactis]